MDSSIILFTLQSIRFPVVTKSFLAFVFSRLLYISGHSSDLLSLRAGAANLDVIQEVEYVKQENKLPYLLHCLQKTEPPALVFCENKKDVDDIQEYLLLKGVEAVAIHGGLAQEERSEAIRLFKCVALTGDLTGCV